jgi:hypothetical protein
MARKPKIATKQASQDQKQPPLRLEWWVPDSLSDNPSNWRRHPDKQLLALKDVLAEVGWAGALLYNERTQRLIDGHARKKISSGKVPVLVGSWSEEQEKIILATLDPLAAMAEADKGILDGLLSQVQTESEAVRALLSNLASGELVPIFDPGEIQGLTDPDDIPDPPDEPITRPGDLWLLGHHRLLCGDSSKAEDVDRLLAGAAIQLAHCDPPYGVNVEPRSNNAIAAGLSSFKGTKHHQELGHSEKASSVGRKLRAKDRPLANDFLPEDEFNKLLHAWFQNIALALQPGRAFFIWGGYSNLPNYPPALAAAGLYYSQAIVWNKLHPVMTRKDFMGCFELAFYGWRVGAAHEFYGPNNAPDLWEVRKVNPQAMIHLTE